MTRIMQTIDVQATPGQVFRFVENAENLPKYLPVTHVDILDSDPTHTKARHDWNVGGKHIEMVSVERVIENGRKLSYTAVEGLPMEATWLLQSNQNGTRVTYLMDYQPTGGFIARLMDRFRLRKDMNRICCEGLQKLKIAVEA